MRIRAIRIVVETVMIHGIIVVGIVVVMLMSTSRHFPVAQHNSESAFHRSQHEPRRDEGP